MTDKKYTFAGLTKHGINDVIVEKVRFTRDIDKAVKHYGMKNSKKVWNKATGQILPVIRCDYVELPHEMTKVEACSYLSNHPDFQSIEDQELIRETISNKSPKTPRTPKTPKVPKVKATVGSLMSRKNKTIDTYEKLVSALA
jgi:hypothetical protein